MSFQLKRFGFVVSILLVALAFGGLACDRQSADEPDDSQASGGEAEGAREGGDEVEREPLPGVDLEGLGAAEQGRFHELVDALSSPCGEAHSLRTSVLEDEDCERAVYAARYVAQFLGDGASDTDIRQFYDERYGDETRHEFSTEDIPRKGPSDARIEIVEFLDYGCPHCKSFGEVLERAQKAWPTEVAVYYRFFPLSSNPNGKAAAQAAVAAKRQDKFEEMHKALFANQGRHDKASLQRYAEQAGLDMEQYQEDFEAAEERVERDRQKGKEVGVRATPTVFINGKEFTDPDRFEYVKLWIEEELAVNR